MLIYAILASCTKPGDIGAFFYYTLSSSPLLLIQVSLYNMNNYSYLLHVFNSSPRGQRVPQAEATTRGAICSDSFRQRMRRAARRQRKEGPQNGPSFGLLLAFHESLRTGNRGQRIGHQHQGQNHHKAGAAPEKAVARPPIRNPAGGQAQQQAGDQPRRQAEPPYQAISLQRR